MSLFNAKKRKYYAIIIWLVNFFSYIPILYLATVDRATGDDWGNSILTHTAWIHTHNLLEVFKAACIHVKEGYYSFQGTWLSVFLFALQPEIFSHKAYWIVPVIMMILTICSISLLIYIVLGLIGISKWDYLLIDGLVVFIVVQFIISTKASIFWYVGAVHYIFPLSLAIVSIVSSVRYIITYNTRYICIMTVCMMLLGGTNYLAALFAPLSIVLLAFILRDSVTKKKVCILIVPFILEVIGLLISVVAPGNKIRGGDQYEITISRMFLAVERSFVEGIKGIHEVFTENFCLLGILIVMTCLIWNIMKDNKCNYSFKYPIVVAFYNFGIYCAMYWPGIFAGVSVSGGVPNTIFQVMILAYVFSSIYICGWIVKKNDQKDKTNSIKWIYKAIELVVFIVALVLVVIGKGDIKHTTTYVCYEYIISGQADDYKRQMDEFTQALLDPNSDEVVVPPINSDQGPLMHMNVTDNKDAWSNRVVADFFGKKSVVSRCVDER